MVAHSHAGTAVDAGFRDHSYPSNLGGDGRPTGEKPESKLWHNDGFWWAVMWDSTSDRYEIYKMSANGQDFTSTDVAVDDRSTTKADVLWDGTKLYIASHIWGTSGGSGTAEFYRYSYNPTTDVYSLDSGYPVTLNNSKTEALIITKDSTGVLWATWMDDGQVYVDHTQNNDDSDWKFSPNGLELPATNANNANSDDLASIVAYNGRVGVLWSNQDEKDVYFASHVDGTSDTSWTSVVAWTMGSSQVADDHINLAAVTTDPDVPVVAAVKTGIDNPTLALLACTGTSSACTSTSDWSNHDVWESGGGSPTRPVVVVDGQNRDIYVFSRNRAPGGGNSDMNYKVSDLDSISFPTGRGTTCISDSTDTSLNDPTSTKQVVNGSTDLVVMVSSEDANQYFHCVLPLAGSAGPPPSVTSFSPTTGGIGTTVTITGSEFTGATNVAFNGSSAAFTEDSDTQVTATVPAAATTGTISVTTADGTGTSSSSFTVTLDPAISSFSPGLGGVGATVTISGANFTGTSAVKFNGVSASFSGVTGSSITATVPAGATTGTIMVTTSIGSGTSASSFTVITQPTITSFTPTEGPIGTGVMIDGGGFTGLSTLTFGGVAALSAVAPTDNQIIATVPFGALTGKIGVTATLGTGMSTTDYTVTLGQEEVVLEETKSGEATSASSVSTSASIGAVLNNLYVASIGTKDGVDITSVSGLGLSWTQVDEQCAGRDKTRVEVWVAQGTPSSGIVTATAASSEDHLIIIVNRYSGVDTTTPTGAVASANTNGTDGSCSGGSDSTSYSFNLTTTDTDSMVHVATNVRNKSHTPGASYTEIIEINGSASLAISNQEVATAGSVTVDGTSSSATDWSVVALEIIAATLPGCGTNADCDDSEPCTDDVCSGGAVCSNTNNTASCNDGLFCNGADTCSGGTCSSHVGDPCGSTECQATCDETADACQDPSGTSCGDAGTACTVQDTCNGAGSCTDNGFFTGGTSCGSSLDTDCTNPDTCDGSGTCLANDETSGASCGDTGTECVVQDTCDGSGSCSDQGFVSSGTSCGDTSATECSDPDACDGAGACAPNHEPGGNPCGDDGTDCVVQDTCSGSGACTDNGFVTNGTTCTDDGNVCTNNQCDGTGSCTHPNNTAACDDSVFCNGADTCAGGTCSVHAGDPCPGPDSDGDCAESCDEAADNCMLPDSDGMPCDDGVFCNGADTCSGGTCSVHAGDPCPGADGDGNCAESCDEASDNCTLPDSAGETCVDGLFCTAVDTCDGSGSCTGSVDPCVGADGDGNCAESCDDVADSCTAPDPAGSSCADGLFCTATDTCDGAGTCSGTGDPCPGADGDGNCAESCDEGADGCTMPDPAGAACGDGSDTECTNPDTCDGAGVCLTNDEAGGFACGDAGTECINQDACDGSGSCTDNGFVPSDVSCGDAGDTECTAPDTCNGAGVCRDNHAAGGAACGDAGTECINQDTCDGGGSCTDNGFVSSGTTCTDDGNGCTDDECDGSGTCDHPDNTAPCEDGLFCNGDDTCSGGGCNGHAGDPCAGGGECANSCDEGADNCGVVNGTPCADDGNVCTNDQCVDGVCDHPDNTSSCDDGLFCNGDDTCFAGFCVIHAGNPCVGADGDANCAESCDDAADNCLGSDPSGSVCGDAGDTECTNPDTCDGAGVCAPNDEPGGTACGDAGTDCVVQDQCDGAGSCADSGFVSGGTTCTDDGNECTDDQCDGAGTCGHLNNTDPCLDADLCNGDEMCGGGSCQPGSPLNCGDGDICTLDTCDSILGCEHDNVCGGGEVILEETRTGGASGLSSVATDGPVTAATDHLYLAAISSKSFESVVSVDGLGLVWSFVAVQCSGRTQTGVELWMALGSPTGDGVVTATLAGAPSNAAIGVVRYSGTGLSNPIGNVGSANTNGVSGGCSGGSDSNAYAFDLTTTESASVVAAFPAMRNRTHDPLAPYVERFEITQGTSGGTKASVALADTLVDDPSTASVAGEFGGSVDWAVIAAEILAGEGGTPTCGSDPDCNDGDPCTTDTCNVSTGECANALKDCADTNDCTDDFCDATGTCQHANNSVPCDDGMFCNGADTCSGGTCSAHAGDPCLGGGECGGSCDEGGDTCGDTDGMPCTDDGNACTDDQCLAGACAHPDNTASCDDGVYCNGTDTCGGGSCSVHTGDPCSAGGECNDACNEGAENCLAPAGASCADDGNTCTDDECDGGGTCLHPDNTAPCPDGDACNGDEMCDGGSCGAGTPPDCDDGDACTLDGCDALTGCTNVDTCGSGEIVLEEIHEGGSSGETTVATDTSVSAMADHLYLAAVSSKSRVDVVSVDGLGLTWQLITKQCSGREQTGVELWMAHGTPGASGPVTATLADAPSNAVIVVSKYSGVDLTDPIGATGAANTNGADGSCSGGSDGSAHDFGLTTTADGSVVYVSPAMRNRNYEPGSGYTENAEAHQGTSGGTAASVAAADMKVETAGSVTVDGTFGGSVDWAVVAAELLAGSGGPTVCTSNADCGDGDMCTTDTCNTGTGVCGNVPVDCTDGDLCTVDSCNASTGACDNDPMDCDDGLDCTDDSCNASNGECENVAPSCDDSDPCTTDSCDEGSGACVNDPVTCDDGNACTDDSCQAGSGACNNDPIDCDDSDACTVDTCNTSTGCVNTDTCNPADVMFEEEHTGGSSGSFTVETAGAVTAAPDSLYLAAISSKKRVDVTGVSGLGLAWNLVDKQCSARSQVGVEVWMAYGSPGAGGVVTASLAVDPANAVIAVTRYSGASATSPIGAVVSANTNGTEGGCSGGSDSGAYQFDLSTTAADSVVYVAPGMRNRDHGPGSGYTEHVEVHQGTSGGKAASVAVADMAVASPSTVSVEGDFTGSVDWAAVAIEIKP